MEANAQKKYPEIVTTDFRVFAEHPPATYVVFFGVFWAVFE